MAGSGMLLLIAAIAVMATGSAFAYGPGTVAPTDGTIVANQGGTLSSTTRTPGQTVNLTTNYSFTSPIRNVQEITSLGSNNTAIKRMWQQLRSDNTYSGHPTGSHWFYLYAENNPEASSSISGIPKWAFYYYTPKKGITLLASTSRAGADSQTASAAIESNASANQGTGSAGFAASTIYADSASTVAIMTVREVRALSGTAGAGSSACAPAATTCLNQFVSSLRWGTAQGWFATGTVDVSQSVETFPINQTIINTSPQVVFVDYFEGISTSNKLTLGNTTPTQTLAGASGTRTTGSTFPFTQTLSDTNGDIMSGAILFEQAGVTSPARFQVRSINYDDNDNSVLGNCDQGATGDPSTQYSSSAEGAFVVPCETNFASTYLGSTPAGAASNVSTTSTDPNPTTQTVTYNLVFSTSARGTWNVYSRADDFHGGTTGLVLQGQIIIQ